MDFVNDLLPNGPIVLLVGVVIQLLWWYVKLRGKLLEEGLSPDQLGTDLARMAIVTGGASCQCKQGGTPHIGMKDVTRDDRNRFAMRLEIARERILLVSDLFFGHLMWPLAALLALFLGVIVCSLQQRYPAHLASVVVVAALVGNIAEQAFYQFLLRHKKMLDRVEKCPA